MADLLEFFEARSRSLDDEGHPVLDASTLQFISLIRFNGIPILPPVVSVDTIILTLYSIDTHFDTSTQTAVENIVGKGEIVHNEQFLSFPQCFLLH